MVGCGGVTSGGASAAVVVVLRVAGDVVIRCFVVFLFVPVVREELPTYGFQFFRLPVRAIQHERCPLHPRTVALCDVASFGWPSVA